MSAQTKEMRVEEENQEAKNLQTEENNSPSELTLPQWSVISFEDVAAGGLSYDEAAKLMAELRQQKISGLCIITDEAAARISK